VHLEASRAQSARRGAIGILIENFGGPSPICDSTEFMGVQGHVLVHHAWCTNAADVVVLVVVRKKDRVGAKEKE